jgi:hypothetical protein
MEEAMLDIKADKGFANRVGLLLNSSALEKSKRSNCGVPFYKQRLQLGD